MRTLVISDLHTRFLRAQHLIDTVPCDKIILLGDYFDSFGDNIDQNNNIAVWLRDLVLTNPKIVPLLGNHDTHYFWPDHPCFRCSGYSDAKKHAIRMTLHDEHYWKFNLYHIDQGFLFTHAGLDNRVWKDISRVFEQKENQSKLDFVGEVLVAWKEQIENQIKFNRKCELLSPGWDRGGRQEVGGINWVDFSNISPVQGVNQIVGHTPHRVPEVKIQKKNGAITVKDIFQFYDHAKYQPAENPLSINYALDTHNDHYMVIEDGEVQIFDASLYLKIQDIKQQGIWIPETPLNNLS